MIIMLTLNFSFFLVCLFKSCSVESGQFYIRDIGIGTNLNKMHSAVINSSNRLDELLEGGGRRGKSNEDATQLKLKRGK